MKKNIKRVIINFLLCLTACLEFQEVRVAKSGELALNFPPMIDKGYVSPPLTSLLEPVKIGEGCHTEINFKIPPIFDNNREDRFYYLWFFDKTLIAPQSVIESTSRDTAIITLSLKRTKLETLLGYKLGKRFFEQQHMLTFYVADRPYTFDEGRRTGKDAFEDSIYWIVTFSDEPC